MSAPEVEPKFESREDLGNLEAGSEKLKSLENKRATDAEAAEKRHSGEKLKAKHEVEQAIAGAEKAPKAAERADKKRETPHRGIKKQEYKATMRRVESRLPAYQKVFSKVIHNPVVDKAANVVSKSIARPSGLLGGAVAAFIGLLVIYLNARRVGFEYPAGAAFIFFVSFGWLSGLLIEYLVGAFKRLRK